MTYKFDNGGIIKLQGAGIVPKVGKAIKQTINRSLVERWLNSAKIKGGYKPAGEDLYKTSIDRTPSTFYIEGEEFPTSIKDYGWFGSDSPGIIKTGKEGRDFLANSAWSPEIREYGGIQYVTSPSGGYIVPIGHQKKLPLSIEKYQYTPIADDQFARSIYYKPIEKKENVLNTYVVENKPFIRPLPGPHLQSTMRGASIEKLIAPDGTVHVNQLKKYFSNASNVDKEIVMPILEELPTNSRVLYNQLRENIQKKLGKFDIKYTSKYSDVGLPRIGREEATHYVTDANGEMIEVPIDESSDKVKTVLFNADPQYYGLGSKKHFEESPLGHVRSMVTAEEPKIYHILESQSDKYQHFSPKLKLQQVRLQYPFGPKVLGPEEETGLTFNEASVRYEPAIVGKPSLKVKDVPEEAWRSITNNDLDLWDLEIPSTPQEIGLSKFWEERQLVEAINDAVKNGQTTVRFPVDETAAKIEGYGQAMNPVTIDYSIEELPELNSVGRLRNNEKAEHVTLRREALLDWENGKPVSQKYIDFLRKMAKKYSTKGRKAEFEDVLQHYRMFPKRLKNIGIDNYSIVKDPKGIEWYQFNIPDSYLNGTAEYRAFKNGGILKTEKGQKINFSAINKKRIKNFKYIDEQLKNAGYGYIQRLAILGNIQKESGGNPLAVSNSGAYHGLIQWDHDRYRIRSNNEQEELKRQVEVLLMELKQKGWGGKTWRDQLAKADEFKNSPYAGIEGLRNATDLFTRSLVRPLHTEEEIDARFNIAKSGWMDPYDTEYDLESAKKALPSELINAWRMNPNNAHLPSGYTSEDGRFHFLKSPQHDSYNEELDFEQDIRNAKAMLPYYGIANSPSKFPEYLGWGNSNEHWSTKYQRGGNLIYTPLLDDEVDTRKEKKRNNNQLRSIITNTEPSFPVEPVSVYVPKEIEYKPETELEVPTGEVVYKQDNMNVGNMSDVIDFLVENGVKFRITSGYRPGAITKSGKPSYHSFGNAIDITPIKGEDFNKLRQYLNNPNVVKGLEERGIKILDETTKEMMSKTGATGPHLHLELRTH